MSQISSKENTEFILFGTLKLNSEYKYTTLYLVNSQTNQKIDSLSIKCNLDSCSNLTKKEISLLLKNFLLKNKLLKQEIKTTEKKEGFHFTSIYPGLHFKDDSSLPKNFILFWSFNFSFFLMDVYKDNILEERDKKFRGELLLYSMNSIGYDSRAQVLFFELVNSHSKEVEKNEKNFIFATNLALSIFTIHLIDVFILNSDYKFKASVSQNLGNQNYTFELVKKF